MTPFVWTDLEVRRALGLSGSGARDDLVFRGISTDSRTIQDGDLFVALIGDHFDGHEFVEQALSRGAAGAVVSKGGEFQRKGPVYQVADTLVALGDAALHRRRAHPARVVGITGSTGKTTTKEMTRGAVAETFMVHATEANLNNRIGLPLTLLQTPDEAEVVVVEMGSSEPGEIAELTRIAEPEIGVVTTVGEAHLEKLGSKEGVFREKLALLDGLSEGGQAVVGDEPPDLPARARGLGRPVHVAGWSDRADPDLRPGRPTHDAEGRYRFQWSGESVSLRIPGRHAVQDALLALAVARLLGVDEHQAARGVRGVEPAAMRGELRPVGGLSVLVDCYNANPQSVRAALDLLVVLPSKGRRIAVLGSMLELGTRSESLHRELLSDALGRSLDLVVATGFFADAADGLESAGPGTAELIADPNADAAYEELRRSLAGDETILLKGSRGVRLERLLDRLESDFGLDEAGDFRMGA